MKSNLYPKTYGRKRGKKNKYLISRYRKHVNKYLLEEIPINKEIIVEIGSGNGENIINLSKLNPNKLIIACEVYVDGNASLVSKLREKKIINVKIFEKSCFFLLEKLKKNSIQEFWILYPDPWPKKKHYKRRLIGNKFIEFLYYGLKNEGKIYLATDDNHYFMDILLKFCNFRLFRWENDRPNFWSRPFKKMARTSFFIKANKNSNKSNFLIFSKKYNLKKKIFKILE